jgi:CsoR family transcriptional regulator, copper-sensing transcriptional repressor
MSSYIKAESKQNLADRMDRIEGQAKGIRRMIDREAYCIDIVTQITSLVAASEKVATILLKDHLDHCVREALDKGQDPGEKTEEVKAAIERFLRV